MEKMHSTVDENDLAIYPDSDFFRGKALLPKLTYFVAHSDAVRFLLAMLNAVNQIN